MSTKPPTPWRRTPLNYSTSLSRAAACHIHLKLENLQPAGSFKSRGIGNYMLARLAERSDASQSIHFYSSSGGNAGLAAVHSARTLHLPCTVIVPMTTQPLMIAKIKEAGAHAVIQRGASWREADTFLRDELLAQDPGGVYVPPFDHPDIWAGNASMIAEAAAQWREGNPGRKPPSAIVCSVGGGGLFCGLMQGLREVGAGWENVPVVALETKGADSLSQSVRADELVTLSGITSQARCLGATRVARQAFEWATGRRRRQTGEAAASSGPTNVISALVSDAEAAMGCWRFADGERMLVEMACGVNVAVCFGGRLERILGRKLGAEEEVLVVVCGGSDLTVERLVEMKREYGDVEGDEGKVEVNGV